MPDITTQVTWNSDNQITATIDPTGLATGVAVGTANISASLSGITSPPISLTIVAPTSTTPSSTSAATLSSIVVTTATQIKLAVGATQPFTATGTYSDGSTANITSQVSWASDTTTIATIDPTGLATGVAPGTANITASMSGVTSPAVNLTVATLSSIVVTPSTPASLAVDASQQFAATGTYSDGSTADITSLVSWVTDNSGTVIVDPYGLATGISAGTADITATLAGITSPSVSVTIVAPSSTTTSP